MRANSAAPASRGTRQRRSTAPAPTSTIGDDLPDDGVDLQSTRQAQRRASTGELRRGGRPAPLGDPGDRATRCAAVGAPRDRASTGCACRSRRRRATPAPCSSIAIVRRRSIRRCTRRRRTVARLWSTDRQPRRRPGGSTTAISTPVRRRRTNAATVGAVQTVAHEVCFGGRQAVVGKSHRSRGRRASSAGPPWSPAHRDPPSTATAPTHSSTTRSTPSANRSAATSIARRHSPTSGVAGNDGHFSGGGHVVVEPGNAVQPRPKVWVATPHGTDLPRRMKRPNGRSERLGTM